MPKPLVYDTPPHFPTLETRTAVQQYTAFGLDVDQIAFLIGATPPEVKILYATELRHGLAHCNSQVAAAMLRLASAGDYKAARFWLEARAGWTGAPRVAKGVDPAQPADSTRQALLDRIVAMLSPEQAVALVRQETGVQPMPAPSQVQPAAQPVVAVPKPGSRTH